MELKGLFSFIDGIDLEHAWSHAWSLKYQVIVIHVGQSIQVKHVGPCN